MKSKPAEERQPAPEDMINNAIIDTLQNIRGGWIIDDLSKALEETVVAVRQAGKSGKLTLTIDVKPASKGSGRALVLSDTIKTKLPELEKEATILYAEDSGRLHRNNPDQLNLQLSSVTVEKPAAEPIDLAATQ